MPASRTGKDVCPDEPDAFIPVHVATGTAFGEDRLATRRGGEPVSVRHTSRVALSGTPA
jgi:hypothetical protein